ncbi:MAG: twin-arginine translocase TatA/TatE family subunit [Actinomycetota bacterium]
MPNLRPQELLIILVIILVLFGGSRLPQLARNLGQAQKEFKSGLDEADGTSKKTEDEPEGSV